jgi:hypothetical protein
VGSSKTLLPLAEIAGVMARARICTTITKNNMTSTGIFELSDIYIVL